MPDFQMPDGVRLLPRVPVSVVGPEGGAYAKALLSGTIGAGITGGSDVYAFRFNPSAPVKYALVRGVLVSLAGTATAFTAGVGNLKMFAARSFSASDSGGTAGTLTGNNGKLRTSYQTTGMADIRIANTGALTAGTYTADADPIAAIPIAVSATADVQFVPANTPLLTVRPGESPLVCAANEGFVLQTTMPATGTWVLGVTTIWDEVAAY